MSDVSSESTCFSLSDQEESGFDLQIAENTASITSFDSTKKKRRRKPVRSITDINTIRSLVSNLQICHLSSSGSFRKCNCLCTTDFDSLVSLFQASREFVSLLNDSGNANRREFIRSFLQASIVSKSNDGKRTMYRYTIGSNSQTQAPRNVCRYVFIKAYDINDYLLKKVQKELSTGTFHANGVLDDRSATSMETYERLTRVLNQFIDGKSHELKTDGFYFAQSLLPNTVTDKLASAWMELHFASCGDYSPSCEEIHLERTEKRRIWMDYRFEMKNLGIHEEKEILSYSAFVKLWNRCFTHVKIREYKAVTGKCMFCASLSDLRCRTQRRETLKLIKEAHTFHRSTYMNSRRVYYTNIMNAVNYPDKFMSIIMDGMAQNHTELPYLGGLKDAEKKLSMHLLGILEHGQNFTMYRSFENVKTGADLAIYCFLSQLEARIRRYGKLPPTITVQIDGGSENANVYLIATCELIVSLGLTERIFLTRLPVGHTHEDIDGKFGKLWQYIKGKPLVTPQEYSIALKECYSRGDLPFELLDIFIVPNLIHLLSPFIDKEFGKCFKEDSTQLAWQFEKVAVSSIFPLGVKVSYKKYACDEAYELSPSEENPFLPLKVVKIVCNEWFPKKNDSLSVPHDGMYVLKQIPIGVITPSEFSPDHLTQYRKCKERMPRISKRQEVISEWESFSYPQFNTSTEYLENGGLFHFPLKDLLFFHVHVPSYIRLNIPLRSAVARGMFDSSQASSLLPSTVIALPSVVWSQTQVDTEVTRYLPMPKLTIPSKIEITPEEERRLENKEITLYDLVRKYYSKRLMNFEAYNAHTIDDLTSRIQIRSLYQKVCSVKAQKKRWNKADLVNILVDDDATFTATSPTIP